MRLAPIVCLALAGCGGQTQIPPIPPCGAIGDSLTFGTGASIPYPSRLSTLLGVPVKNYGVGGYTTQNLTDHADEYQTPTLFVMVGHNDVSWQNAEALYTTLAERLWKPGRRVYWSAPVLDRDGLYREKCDFQEKALKAVISKQVSLGRKFYFVNAYRELDGKATYSDRWHLDDAGYQMLAESFYNRHRVQ